MRILLTLAIILLAGLAGCVDGGDDSTDSADPADTVGPGSAPAGAKVTEYCLSEELCDFWDEQFHGYVVYDLDTPIVDAVVMPVPGLDTASASETARMATAQWGLVENLAADWFVDGFQLNTYLVGTDIPSADAIADPEILVVSESAQRSTSIGLNAEQVVCGVIGGAYRVYPIHEHDNMAILAADCVTGGFRCVALNFAGALGGNYPLYDLVAHEVGHCLGAGHVGDALDFNAKYVPEADIMAYADNPSRVSCPSTLNARVLEGIYGHLLGQPEEMWLPDGSYYGMDPMDYAQTECELPPTGLL